MTQKEIILATYEFWGKVLKDITIEIDAKDKATALLELTKLSETDIMKRGRIRARQDVAWDLSDIWQVTSDNQVS